MKKNWIIVGGIVVLLSLYQVLVLNPYNKKYVEPKREAQRQAQVQNKNQENGGAQLQTEQLNNNIKSTSFDLIQLNEKEQAKLYSNGTLAEVEYQEFYEDIKKKEKYVSELNNGVYWSSTNTDLQACLSSLTKSLGKNDQFIFQAQSNYFNCTLNYTLQGQSLITSQLILEKKENAPAIQGTISLQLGEELGDRPELNKRFINYQIDGDSKSLIGFNKMKKAATLQGKLDWAAWGDKYFVSLFLPQGNYNPNLVYSANENSGLEKANLALTYPLAFDGNLKNLTYEYKGYFGKRDYNLLKSIDPNLEDVADFGFFSSIARVMLNALNFLYSFLHNYGLAIIALTLIVRILFWPLNKSVYSSSQKMKDIQPQMEAVKAKYKGKDKAASQQMNMEIMQLYKKNKVNPAGSCLPMLLQMPIFFGLYRALGNSVELYHAPFYGWIQDLSAADPYFILPAFWTITMLVTMQFTPQQTSSAPGMPNMKWIMMVMYVAFGFFSKSWPAGLLLYLCVSSLVGIFQQYALKKSVNTKKKSVTVIREGV